MTFIKSVLDFAPDLLAYRPCGGLTSQKKSSICEVPDLPIDEQISQEKPRVADKGTLKNGDFFPKVGSYFQKSLN